MDYFPCLQTHIHYKHYIHFNLNYIEITRKKHRNYRKKKSIEITGKKNQSKLQKKTLKDRNYRKNFEIVFCLRYELVLSESALQNVLMRMLCTASVDFLELLPDPFY